MNQIAQEIATRRSTERLRWRKRWVVRLGFVGLVALGIGRVWALPDGEVLRFSDTPALQQPASTDVWSPSQSTAAEAGSAMVLGKEWLKQNGWEQIWPLTSLGNRHLPSFAGPAAYRYLRLNADEKFYIWGHLLNVDPQRLPMLEITWGVEQFPREAALDVYGRNDRSIVVTVSFGPKVPSGGLRPNVPRGLAFFWGETETVGASYTCIKPRTGPDDKRMQCTYPHVKYIALRRGEAGSIHTEWVNLLTSFRDHFPDYWEQHQRVPPVVAVSFEVRSDQTNSVTVARLYTIGFRAAPSPDGQVSGPDGKGN